MSRERHFITQGTIKELKKDKEYNYYLFNDLILFAGEKRLSGLLSSSRKYIEKDRCLLRLVEIARKDDENRVMVLKTVSRTWIMKFKTQKSYLDSVTIIENTISIAPQKKPSRRKLSYSLDGERTTLLDKPETEGECTCIIS